ncbi:ribonuclease H-like domain-containing protein [Tanacetum coccineum]|uniref:Ribonuclease H-like domain-containing protein n=1 Tax=Tanacetum coccineum TaxID=301880 RepID=A0ABQ5IXG2_9ASTR
MPVTLGLVGPTAAPGQETTLPHAFTTGTPYDPAFGAWNFDTGASSHLNNLVNSLSENFNTCIDLNWQNALRDEYHELIKNKTWTLVPRPLDTNIVHCMWLFSHKYLVDGTLSRYKARLVANGSTQLEGIDVDETFSLAVKPGTIQTVLSLAASQHWPIFYQFTGHTRGDGL